MQTRAAFDCAGKAIAGAAVAGSVRQAQGTRVDGRTGGIRDGRDEMQYSLATKHHRNEDHGTINTEFFSTL
jgi:hypothetical protein